MVLNLTEHFSFNEMTRSARFPELESENRSVAVGYLQSLCKLCAQLELARAMFSQPIYISSGFRSPALNKAVGGADTSQHQFGTAADFIVDGYRDLHGMQFVFDWCRNHLDYRQLILETPPGRKPWIHIGLPNGDNKREALIFDGKSYVPAP